MIGLSRMISISARGGIDIYTIIDQLNSTGSCPSYTVRRATRKDTSRGSCCPMAVGNALLDMYNEVQEELAQRETGREEGLPKAPKPKAVPSPNQKLLCPECGEAWYLKAAVTCAKAADGANACKPAPAPAVIKETTPE